MRLKIYLSVLLPFFVACTEEIKNHDQEEVKMQSSNWNHAFATRDVELFLSMLAKEVQISSAGGKCANHEGSRGFLNA